MVAAGAWMLFNQSIPEDNREFAYMLYGALIAKWGDSIAYFVGTTRSSAEKTKLLGK
jgi:CDP-diglyceride synthetase